MTRARTRSWVLILVLGLTCAATPAAAELNIDLYGGAAWLPPVDAKVRGQGTNGADANLTILDVHTDTGFTVGGRLGYWLDPLPFLGLDLDVFYIQMPVPAQTRTGTGALTGELLGRPISVTGSGVASSPSVTLPLFGFAPEIRLRLPLVTDAAFPAGRLQPYIFGGPSWAFSLKDDHIAMQFGGKAGGGVSFNITRFLALFGEYRFIFYPGFEFKDKSLTYEADINSHSVVGGISFRF